MQFPAENPGPEQMQLFDRNGVLPGTETVRCHSRTNGFPTLSRTLKIEEAGDFWRKKTHPKIRLKGQWLKHAGFKAGNHVSVNCVAPGVIELKSDAHAPGSRGVP